MSEKTQNYSVTQRLVGDGQPAGTARKRMETFLRRNRSHILELTHPNPTRPT